jgi:hypothetical protein
MDRYRFDAIARLLAMTGSRRTIIGALLGAGLLGHDLGTLARPGKGRGKARKRRERKRKRGRGRVVVCHSGETLTVPWYAVHAILLDGGTRGACAAPGGGPGAGDDCLLSTADLQGAIDSAQVGATLSLCAGTFSDIAVTIGKDLTLVGAGKDQTILNNDGGCICAVIEVAKGATVTVQDLAIVKGAVSYWGMVNYGALTVSEVDITGGGLPANGAGIYNEGTLTLGDGANIFRLSVSNSGAGIYNDGGAVTLQAGSNVTTNHAVFGDGGGIFNYEGTLTLQAGSNVTDNFASHGGGIHTEGGTLLLQGGSVAGNGAGIGAGIYVDSGNVTLDGQSSVTNNSANISAGGIYNDGTLTLKAGSRVAGNATVTQDGGGIYNDGNLTLQNGSSVTGNTVGGPGGNGGGIFTTGTAVLEAGSRVTGNTVGDVGGLGGDGGGIYFASGSVTLDSTDIVTNNHPNNCSGSPPVPNCIG